jgi:hypothetical protein
MSVFWVFWETQKSVFCVNKTKWNYGVTATIFTLKKQSLPQVSSFWCRIFLEKNPERTKAFRNGLISYI